MHNSYLGSNINKRQKIYIDINQNKFNKIKNKIKLKEIDNNFIKENYYNIIKIYKNSNDWKEIFYILIYNDTLNDDIIRFIHRKNYNLINWNIFKNHKILSPEFILEFTNISENKLDINIINFINLQKNYKLSFNFIKFLNDNYPNKIDWFIISFYQKINSDKFIMEFHNQLNWSIISYNYELNEYIIEKFINKVDWFLISQFQNLSEKFIIKYIDYIKPFWLKKNIKIDFRFFSYNFLKVMSYNGVNFNEYYKYKILLKKIQRWWNDLLYKPNGIFYNKIKLNFNKSIHL